MPAAPYGQFGTAGYPQKTIPKQITLQYPGSHQMQSALGMFGNLAYGPYSQGLSDVESAQQADPMAEQYQQIMKEGGGAYAQPGLGTGAVGQLFAGQMANEAQRQKTQHESTMKALEGMGDVGKSLADSIYSQESAANKLTEAENAALSAKISGALDLTATAIDLYYGQPSQAASAAAGGTQTGQASGAQAQQSAGFPGTFPGSMRQSFESGPSVQDMFSTGYGVGYGPTSTQPMGAMDLTDLSSMFSSMGPSMGPAALQTSPAGMGLF